MGKPKKTFEKVSKKRPGSAVKTECSVCGADIEGLSEWTSHQKKCVKKEEIARRESQRRAAAAAAEN